MCSVTMMCVGTAVLARQVLARISLVPARSNPQGSSTTLQEGMRSQAT